MIGKKILDYEVKSLIGEGGMGNVYLGEHSSIGRKVAIKVLRPELSNNEDIRKRFKNEAKVMASLKHQGIVTLFHFHEDENGLYLIMEYVEGDKLSDKIKNLAQPMEISHAKMIMKQVLEAFSCAHKNGVIHRDVKPDNILISSNGHVKILDFGIAKILGNEQFNLTKTGMQVGTTYYMSPEQVKASEIDARSDIYSLGVTFYELLSGHCPYRSLTSEYEIYNKILKDPLNSLVDSMGDEYAQVWQIIQKATAKDSKDRYHNCEEMITDLENDQVNQTSKASTITEKTVITALPEPIAKPKSKRTLWLVLITVVAVVFSMIFLKPYLFGSKEMSDEVITNEEEELVDNFEISGTINGGENVSVYLEALSQQGRISVAEARTDASGSFKMSGNIPGFGLYQLRLGESQDKIIPMTLVPDDKIKINANFATYELKPNLSGSKWAITMNDYMAVFSKFHAGQQELMNKRDSIPAEELTDLFMKLKAPIDSFSLVRMDKDPSNPFNIVLQGAAVPSMGFNDWDEKNLEVLKKVASAFEEKYPGSPVTTTMTNQVYQIEMEYNQHIANSSGTRVAPEIALKNPDGVEMKLSSLRGQYVLIDFWASWCMPCRRENPNVVQLYNKYKNKGFTIFSVSLDKDAEAWKEAIEKDGLVWQNHVSDLLQWNSPLPQLYGFSGIPHTVLVNPEGNIIGVGLRGASLEQKLEEIFAK